MPRSRVRHEHFVWRLVEKVSPSSAWKWPVRQRGRGDVPRNTPRVGGKTSPSSCSLPNKSWKPSPILTTFLRVVSIPGVLKAVVADPDDDKVLDVGAEIALADHVVTGDRRHLLPMGTFKGILIVTAADFLAIASKP